MPSAAKIYLVGYNGIECILWSYLTIITLYGSNSAKNHASGSVTHALSLLAITQTLALLEVLHALLGLVRSSPATTALQIGGKNLVVWLVMFRFRGLIEQTSLGRAAYLGCLLAWGFSEMSRYGFFCLQLSQGEAPKWLLWLRYNAFLLLYPIGLLSEAALVWVSLTQGADMGIEYKAFLSVGLLLYIPAGPYLYSHMLAQRRKMQGKTSH